LPVAFGDDDVVELVELVTCSFCMRPEVPGEDLVRFKEASTLLAALREDDVFNFTIIVTLSS
jgi:hypothetical protein